MKSIFMLISVLSSFACFANELKVDLSIPSEYQLTSKSRLKITLYGYDRFLADASASRLNVNYVKITNLNQRIQFPVKAQISSDIDQGAGPVPVNQAGYYIVVSLDLDGDGQVCPGDLSQNYDLSNIVFFKSFPSPIIKIVTTEIVGNPNCEEF